MIIYLFLFLGGLLVGSFLNVVIYREINEESRKPPPKKPNKLSRIKDFLPPWVVGRSCCDHCRHQLKWYDNIPLLSFIMLGGKCRYCHRPINLQYPLVEFLTAVEFIWLYWLLSRFAFFARAEGFYSFILLLYWLYIFSSLLVIFITDFKAGIIPDWVVLPAILISFLRLFESNRWQFFLAGFGSGLFFYFLYLITQKRGLGFGDVKLAFLMGLFLGYPQILTALFLAFLTGAVTAVILIMLGKKRFGQTLPFGPFLVLGTIIAKFWGEMMWQWYWRLIT